MSTDPEFTLLHPRPLLIVISGIDVPPVAAALGINGLMFELITRPLP
jgi:hypothetical protein